MTYQALQAAEILARDGIQARVVNMSTLKPIDKESIMAAAEETGAIVTAENHNILGGLGSAVAEVLVENRLAPMARVGIQDVFGETGSNLELLHKYGMSAEHIADAARKVHSRKETGEVTL